MVADEARTVLTIGLLIAGAACAGAQAGGERAAKPAPSKPSPVAIHLGESWYELRAEGLGMSSAQAKLRDAALGDDGPPGDVFWDEQLAVESTALWRALCRECHGGSRKVEAAKEIAPPGADWGRSEGSFFGRERPHEEVFQIIFHGSAKPPADGSDPMPAWGDKLSREQIWGLVYYVEHESKRASDLREK